MKNKLTALEKDILKKEKEAKKIAKMEEKLKIKEINRIEKLNKFINVFSEKRTKIILNKSLKTYIKYEKETLKNIEKLNKYVIKINNNINKKFKIKDDSQLKKSSKKVKKIIKNKNDEKIINNIIEFKDENNIINNKDIEDNNDE